MIDPKLKLCGVLIPVFALRREGSLGIGDTEAMRKAVEFCSRNNLTVLQVLPINETGGDNSPYNAISSIALDPVLMTVEPHLIPGLTAAEYSEITSKAEYKGEDRDSVHYNTVKAVKNELLKAAWKKFSAELNSNKDSLEVKAFAAFEKEHKDWLEPYTLFRTLVDVHGGNACWTQWQPEQQTRKSAEEWAASSTNASKIADTRRFYAYVQWLAFKQWTDLRKYADEFGVKLMGDIPFGVSRYSADVWSERNLFEIGWSGGAPPEPLFQSDPFTAKWGQNWGIPLYKWDAHKKENYQWWRRRIQRLTDIFHYFRIDHVLGFFRMYAFPWIPERNHEFVELDEDEAKEITGGDLPEFKPRKDYPEKLGKVNCEEGKARLKVIMDAAGENGVVAEDLGMVPWYVRPLLHEIGIPGFAIPIFERDEEDKEFKDKSELHPCSLATYGTHDHMPLAMYYDDLVTRWHGPDGHEAWLDVQRLMRFLGRDDENPPKEFTDELHEDFEKALLETPCWLALFMMPDILGTYEQFNVPGTADAGNWSRRLAKTLEDYENDELYGPKIKRLSKLIAETDRLASRSPARTVK
jgi:4-alpha-glucanotransferase